MPPADTSGPALGFALEVDAGSSAPPFEQLRTRIRDAVVSGELAAGARLPTVRAVAAETGLAVNTVARAYKELEADALIETRGRLGSFVAATGSPVEQQLQQAARAYADRAAALGVAPTQAAAAVSAALGLRP
ncbi:GntR family transcriptional regulator [Herbiconiux liangxiaofengii]|uniref:GntR family transcriptional regulator n=1 Tax=Herbiconiux liangxiaofengii TaxID=3342795 RepID=UPI0035B9ED23